MQERHGDDRLNRLRSDSEHLVVALERTHAPGAPVVVTRGDVDGAIGTDEDVAQPAIPVFEQALD